MTDCLVIIILYQLEMIAETSISELGDRLFFFPMAVQNR